MSWPTVALGEVAEVVSGATPKTATPEYWDGDISWATPKDLSGLPGRRISATSRNISEAGLSSCAARILPEGSVLLSSRAPIGLVAINDVPMATNQGLKSLIPGSELDSGFLAHWLVANVPLLQSLGNGVTFKEISKQSVSQVQIPLPPLDEQRRIAAILDHVDALRAKAREAVELAEEAVSALFQSTQMDEEIRSLADWGWDFTSGKNVVGTGENVHARNLVLKVSAISSGVFLPDEVKPLPAAYVPSSQHAVSQGDLLFGRASGSLALLGAVALVDKSVSDIYLPDKVWKLSLPSSERWSTAYARLLFRSEAFRNHVAENASGAAGVKNISRKSVLAFSTRMPTVESFAKFAKRESALQEVVRRSREQVDHCEALFTSLQSSAFRGEL